MVMSAIVLIERVDGILIILYKTTKVYGTNPIDSAQRYRSREAAIRP
jgi:hypothetical protein